MFEIYRKEVTIKVNGKEETYSLLPLSGEHLPKLYQVMSKLTDVKKDGTDFMKEFDETTVSNLHAIALETFKRSYPEQKVEALDSFVAQNLLVLLEAVISVNVNVNENAPSPGKSE